MKLHFRPGACSLAPHIAMREAGLPFRLIRVDCSTRRTEGSGVYVTVNHKGYLPALVLEAEAPVILQYLGRRALEAGLLPAHGIHRLRSLEWLSFMATELHKSFSPLFGSTALASFLRPGKQYLRRRSAIVADHPGGRAYLSGAKISLPDLYLFVACRWLADQGTAFAKRPELQRHSDAVGMRPAVQKALSQGGPV